MLRSLMISFLGAMLVGCGGDISVADAIGGRLLDYERGDIVLERKLTQIEAKNATDWLRKNGKNWGADYASSAPDVLAYLEHSDGTSSGLYVYPGTVVFVSGGGQLKKSFSEDQTQELILLLGLGREG